MLPPCKDDAPSMSQSEMCCRGSYHIAAVLHSRGVCDHGCLRVHTSRSLRAPHLVTTHGASWPQQPDIPPLLHPSSLFFFKRACPSFAVMCRSASRNRGRQIINPQYHAAVLCCSVVLSAHVLLGMPHLTPLQTRFEHRCSCISLVLYHPLPIYVSIYVSVSQQTSTRSGKHTADAQNPTWWACWQYACVCRMCASSSANKLSKLHTCEPCTSFQSKQAPAQQRRAYKL